MLEVSRNKPVALQMANSLLGADEFAVAFDTLCTPWSTAAPWQHSPYEMVPLP